MFRNLMVLIGLAALLGCAESATEPEAPEGWQMVLESGADFKQVVAAVASGTELTDLVGTLRPVQVGGAFTADLRDEDTVLVGYLFGVSTGANGSVRITGDLRASPTSRYPVRLHDFMLLVEVVEYSGGKELSVRTSRSAERQPSGDDSFRFLHEPDTVAGVWYHNYTFFVLRAITCEREGRNTLRSKGLTVRLGDPSFAFTIDAPDIEVTCHRAVSSASVRGGPSL